VDASVVSELEVTVTDRVTGASITAWIRRAGSDVVAVVGGGERPHVGVVVVAQPYPSRRRPGRWSASSSVVTIPPHKEEPVARGLAERLVAATGGVVVVTAGVHDDGLGPEGISTYLELAERLQERVAERVRDAWGEPPGAPPR
jgi:hypothetical protein